jgi:hypothetical protein
VFLAKSHFRTHKDELITISAAWRHHRLSSTSNYCEQRSVSKEGKEELKQFSTTAHNQRLKLFNRRFWEIFKYKKLIPPNMKARVKHQMGESTFERMVIHCHDRWDVPAIMKSLPEKIKFRTNNKLVEEALRNHPAAKAYPPGLLDELVEDYANTKFSVLRLKILGEAISWLGTKSALDAFTNVLCLSFIDCLEILPPPIHSSSIAEMMILHLVLTDWEEAIAHLEEKTRAIGFG